MRYTVKWVCCGTIATAAMLMSACQRQSADPRLKFRTSATVTITADCTTGNQVDVGVDNWVLRMKKRGDVTFRTQTTTGASVEITQKTPASWPFDEAPPFTGNAKGKIKDKQGDFRYNVRVACAAGASGDSVRVMIDPDIIVD